jgi:hypothetical protein
MRSKNILRRPMVFFAVLVLAAAILSTITVADPVPKTIQGQVDPEPVDGALAFPGVATFYIQSRTNEGKDVEIMYQGGGVEYYFSPVEDNITDWNTGDTGVMIVDVEHGTYVTNDRIGYVAYSTMLLDATGAQTFPTVDLQKIPIAMHVADGVGFINVSWSALPDPDNLIAGYKVYRSDTNASDPSWTLVGGSVNAPLTDLWFEDTTVTGGATYYYSIKICFIGYSNGPVDNHQNAFFGEGSAPMSSPVSGLNIDYINLTTGAAPDGPLLDNDAIDVGKTIQIWASGYNTSTNPHSYVPQSVVVDWSHVPALGSFFPTTGDNTMFTAGDYQGGTTTVTGDDGGGLIDTGDIIVNPPTVDYILLTDAFNGTELSSEITDIGVGVTVYASGYNGSFPTGTYVGPVEVTWGDTGGLGTFNPPTGIGTSTIFTGDLDGLTNITGTNASWFDEFELFINPAPLTVDNIKIVDMAGGIGATEIADQLVQIDVTISGWAASYNGTTYLGDVAVDWTVTPSGSENATTDPGPAITADFWSGWIGGSVIWTADYMTGTYTDTVTFTINPPQVDYIEIVDIAGGVGVTPIPDHAVNVGDTVTGYAASYNLVTGYLGDIPVDWSVTNASGATASTLPLTGVDSSVFSAGMTDGQATWTADDGAGHMDSVIIDITPPTEDYITIVDEMGTGQNEIDDQTVGPDFILVCYVAAFNDTSGYLYDVSVNWNVTNDTSAMGSVDNATGFIATFNSGAAEGDATLNADFGGIIDSVIFTIDIVYTIDYITIVDTENTGITEIADQTVGVGFTIMGYVASFNDSAPNSGYLGDITVTWSVAAIGTTTPLTGLSSEFNAGLVGDGDAVWTADDGAGHTDTVTFSVPAPTIDSIKIESAQGGSGTEIGAVPADIGSLHQWYCVAYNDTSGYIGEVSATWGVTGGIGTVSQGTFTQFNATTEGTGTVTATFNSLNAETGTITVTTPGDTTPPLAPTGLVVSQVPAGGALNLAWTANTEEDLDGYNVYRSTSATGTFTMLNTAALLAGNSYSDTTVTEGTTYYYYVIAVDDSANESPDSTVASNTADRDTDGDNTYNLQDDDDDGDTLTDAEEATLGTNPLLADTDGDGHNDAEDKYPLDETKWKDDDDGDPDFPIWIIIIIIVVIVLILLLVMMKGKPKEAMPPPEMPEEEVPPPEEEVPPPEEEMPPEEEVPPPDEEVPPPDEEIPPEEEEAPPVEEEAPPVEEDVPPADEPAPPPDESAPPSEDDIPPPP